MSVITEAPRQSAAPAKRMYDPGDVAGFFGVSRFTILEWIKAGRLPQPVRIGRTIRWPVEVIDALISR